MRDKHRSFFWRLLYAFFAVGSVPLFVLSILLNLMTTDILENAYRKRADAAVAEAASNARQLLSDAARIAEQLASSKAAIDYARTPERDSILIAECNRLLSSSMASLSISPYIIPADGSAPLARGGIPEEYDISLYRGWGILGELGRENEAVAYFAQPHPLSERPVPLAVGTRIRHGQNVVGFIVVDLGRNLFVQRIGAAAHAGGALTSLCLTDPSGCIIYDMADQQRESTFFDAGRPPSAGEYLARQSSAENIRIYGTFSVRAAREYAERVIMTTSVIAAISIVASLAVAIALSKTMSRPVHTLTVTMERVSQGQLDTYCPEFSGRDSSDEIAVLIRQFNRMIGRVNELVENKLAQERELRHAELKALQAQIDPHFLYNTLNSIRSVAKLEGANDIAAVITSLARILREGAYSGTGFCTVKHSLDLARDYFAIESWRWPDRFRLEESVDGRILEASVPRLIIQPIVDNALAHGLEAKPGRGTLTIEGKLAGGDAIIVIADDGVGIERERLAYLAGKLRDVDANPLEYSLAPGDDEATEASSAQRARSGHGIALVNTHCRLRLIYGPPYGLSIASVKGEGTAVTVRFPLRQMEAEECSS